MAQPTMPFSASGVSMQRSGPNASCNPTVARKTPPKRPTSSPSTTTRLSRRISTRRQSFTAWMMFISGMGRWDGIMPAFDRNQVWRDTIRRTYTASLTRSGPGAVWVTGAVAVAKAEAVDETGDIGDLLDRDPSAKYLARCRRSFARGLSRWGLRTHLRGSQGIGCRWRRAIGGRRDHLGGGRTPQRERHRELWFDHHGHRCRCGDRCRGLAGRFRVLRGRSGLPSW